MPTTPTPENIPASSMSLRDHFAAEAMAALLRKGLDFHDIAGTAYLMADAMLEERTHRPTSWPRLHTNTDFANLR
jgi:hypothetical protein